MLVVGLTRAGQLDPATVDAWVNASKSKKPVLDKEATRKEILAGLKWLQGAQAIAIAAVSVSVYASCKTTSSASIPSMAPPNADEP